MGEEDHNTRSEDLAMTSSHRPASPHIPDAGKSLAATRDELLEVYDAALPGFCDFAGLW